MLLPVASTANTEHCGARQLLCKWSIVFNTDMDLEAVLAEHGIESVHKGVWHDQFTHESKDSSPNLRGGDALV